jgi:hypothetical protein
MNDKSSNETATAVRSSPVIRRESQRKETEAPRERAKKFGGPRLKLDVPGAIPGYHLYWENDDDGAIEQLLNEGFEFVRPDEVHMQSATMSRTAIVADGDVTDRVSRQVGKKEDGTSLRAYLLKCPEDLWKERENYRHEAADERDAAIRAGRVQNPDGMYRPKGVETLVDTGFRKAY